MRVCRGACAGAVPAVPAAAAAVRRVHDVGRDALHPGRRQLHGHHLLPHAAAQGGSRRLQLSRFRGAAAAPQRSTGRRMHSTGLWWQCQSSSSTCASSRRWLCHPWRPQVCNHPDLFEGRPIVSSFDMWGLTLPVPSAATRVSPQSLQAFCGNSEAISAARHCADNMAVHTSSGAAAQISPVLLLNACSCLPSVHTLRANLMCALHRHPSRSGSSSRCSGETCRRWASACRTARALLLTKRRQCRCDQPQDMCVAAALVCSM